MTEPMENGEYLQVNALTKYLKYKFDQDPYLTRVFLKGELSNVNKHTNGHIYFAVKDRHAKIRGIMFRTKARTLKFEPAEGQEVLIEGRVSIYEASGQYQIYAESIQIDGIGMLFEQLEKDKKELRKKGYFDDAHKKPLPRFPRHIAVITSSTSAALEDMLTTFQRRFPLVKVTVLNTLMQGSGSKENVISHLKEADRLPLDVIILARGGGAIEDLWTFNDKDVALGVFNTDTPVITGIGHETDTTLVDFVSDLRAATPTASSEIAVPDMKDILLKLEESRLLVHKRITDRIKNEKQRLLSYKNYYKLRNPELLYDQETERLMNLSMRLTQNMKHNLKSHDYRYREYLNRLNLLSPAPRLKREKERLHQYNKSQEQSIDGIIGHKKRGLSQMLEMLDSLSPTAVLKRGYSYTTKDGKIVRDTETIHVDDHVTTRLHKGSFTAQITEVNRDD